MNEVGKLEKRPLPLGPRLVLAVWVTLALGLLTASCRTDGLRLASADQARIRRIERALAEVSRTTGVLNGQILAVEKARAGADEGMAGELGGLKASLGQLGGVLEALRKDLGVAKVSSASLDKRLEELRVTLAEVDQRLWLLEARYNDHLRKVHGG
ncbi:MAG: hypothetical protein ACREJP_03550 [Candidatus Methylomirabilales bacterium]